MATQKTKPLRNHLFAESLASPPRESHMSGARAKRTSVFSAIGGNAAQRRKPGMSQQTFATFLKMRSNITPPPARPTKDLP